MKKRFTLITAAMMLLAFLAKPSGMWGQMRTENTESVTLSSGVFSTDHITWSCASGNVIITQLKGSSTTAVNSSYIAAPRVYKGHILSFQGLSGYKIKSISITYNSSYMGNSMTAGISVSTNVVNDNTTAVDRTWDTNDNGTHVVSSVSDDGLEVIYIQNVATETNVQLRPTAISITYITPSILPTYTVEYSVNGTLDDDIKETDVDAGDPVDLPSASDLTVSLPTGFSFIGWSRDETSGVLLTGTTFTPSNNTTLYAVFVKSGESVRYNKVNSLDDITPGKYIIVNANFCLPSTTTLSSPVKSNDYLVSDAAGSSYYNSIPDNTEWNFTGTKTSMTIKNSEGSFLYSTSSNTGLRVSSTSDTWAFEENGAGFAMKEANNNRYCASYKNGADWRSYTTKNYSNYNDSGVLYLFKKTQVYTRVYNATTTIMADIPATSIVTVPNGVTLTLTGTNLGLADNLIIEDGGQLIHNGGDVYATMQKSIAAASNWSTESKGWYLIASPVDGYAKSNFSGTYDLYLYDEPSHHWWNANGTEHAFNTLARGKGYLYANEAEVVLSFAGSMKETDDNVLVPLSWASSNETLKGWNLVGNPYSCNAYVNLAYYAMNAAGNGFESKAASVVIPPFTGIFVRATGESQNVTFSTTPPSSSANNGHLQIVLNETSTRGGIRQDNAIVSFNKGEELTKFVFNEENAEVYFTKSNEDYAVAYSEKQGQMLLNFKAKHDGTYTLRFEVENTEMNYLHLIDKLTGNDIDLLATPEYTFSAKRGDGENRFRLVFEANGNALVTSNEPFAYFNGSEWVIENDGEATLQIIDVMGRMLRSENVSGNATTSLPNLSAGVYVLRLVNSESIRTQKVVIE